MMTDKKEIVGQLANLLMQLTDGGKPISDIQKRKSSYNFLLAGTSNTKDVGRGNHSEASSPATKGEVKQSPQSKPCKISFRWMKVTYSLIHFIAFTSVSQLVDHYRQVQHDYRDAKPLKQSRSGAGKNPEKLQTRKMFSVCTAV